MGKIKINLAGTGPVPPGDHTVEVERVTLRDKIGGDSQYLHLALRVVEGKNQGATFDTIASLRPDMLPMLGRTLVAFGIVEQDVEIGWDDHVVKKTAWGDECERVVTSPDLVGKRAIATVVHREVGSQVYPRVRILRALPDA